MNRLTFLCLCLIAAPAAARHPADATLSDDTLDAIETMAQPVVVDRAQVGAAAEAMRADVEALRVAIDGLPDRKQKRALRGHLRALEGRLATLDAQLRKAAAVDLGRSTRPRQRRPDTRAPRHDGDWERDHNRRHPRDVPIVVEAPPPPPAPMAEDRFAAFMKSVDDVSFAAEKVNVVRAVAPKNWFSTSQVRAALDRFAFSENKRDVFRVMYPRMVNPDEGHTLLSAFSFSSDRQAALDIMAEFDAQTTP